MSKGKATRSSTATSSTPAPPPTISNDILTGRFTENEWNVLLEVQEGEEFVFDLLDEIVGGVLDVIKDKHVEESVIPHSLTWAEDIMIKLIDWQFLVHDKGEVSGDRHLWASDDEPPRVPLDSWGRGSVPCRITEHVEELHQEDIAQETVRHVSPSIESKEVEFQEDSLESLNDISKFNKPSKLNELKEDLKYFKLRADDILTLSKIEKPDEPLELLYQAISVFYLDDPQQFEYSSFVKNLDQTREFVEGFGPRPLSEETMSKLKKYVDDIKLHPDHIAKVSNKAAVGLCTWLHKIYTHQILCDNLNVEFTIDYGALRSCIIEMKSLGINPPAAVKTVFCAVVSLLSGKINIDYKVAKKYFSQPDLLIKMENFDYTKLSYKFIVKFKASYLKLDSSQLKNISLSADLLYKWCEDQIYGCGSVIVRPPEPKPKQKRRVVKVAKPDVLSIEHDQVSESQSSLNGLNSMLPHQSAAIVKAQHGRPPGQKEVEYDNQGNVISVVKVNPKHLPSHRVKTKYEIIEPVVTNQRHFSKNLKPLKKRPSMSKQSTSFLLDSHDHTPLPLNFVDAVQASPGVVIKQGSRTKRGPDSSFINALQQQQQSASRPHSQLLYSN